MKASLIGGLFAAALALQSPIAQSQATGQPGHYPDKPIRVIVGFPPGGPNDLIARLISNKLGERLHQSVIVENKPGSNAELAAAYVAKAPPDGYTILFASSGAITISPNMKQLPYDPTADFTPLIALARNPMILVVSADSPYKTAEDLVDAAKASPGKLNYASAGTGSPTHLAGALFTALAGVDAVHVPYKGGGPAMTDLMGGQVQFYFGGIPTALPLVKGGKLRALAITSAQRSKNLPDIPALAETPATKDYEASIWYGFLAPPKTPASVVKAFDDAVAQVLKDPSVVQQFASEGSEIVDMRGKQFADMMDAERKKWGVIVKQAHITDGGS
jgi:tripartite-type tricarboxylate transporter receptor subunit TctC